MGRTSKFTFPVPGRKQKPAAPTQPSTVYAPLTKAEKILGTGELNIDSPTNTKDPSRPWETRSNSGISICISESTTSFTNDSGLERLDEDEVVNGVGRRHARWDDESAILPGVRSGTSSRGNTAMGSTVHDAATDASSLRRRQSSSTINTYYDSTKVPLSISQQTASSAIAKGLPAKASALLDMDGSFASPPHPRKKKPSRLDLSYLLPKSRSAKHLAPPGASAKELVLGPDLVTRSPSLMSVSPDIAPPPIQQRTNRKPRKKLTLETLRGHRFGSTEPNSTDPAKKIRTTASANELHSLYEHYEERSFQEMMGGELATTSSGSGGGSPSYESSRPSAPAARAFLSPLPGKPGSRGVLDARDMSNSTGSGAETGTTSIMTPSSLKSPPTDAASVSSRHTRTSKASKRTDRSMTDIDLLQNSVLSLSSDSEDDYGDRPNTSLSAPRRPSDAQPSPTSPNLNSFPQPPSPQTADVSSQHLPVRRVGPVASNSYSRASPLESPSAIASVPPPRITPRTSSLSTSSRETQKASGMHSASRVSLASTSTATTVTVVPNSSSSRGDNAVNRDARAIALIPAHNFRYSSGSHTQSPHRRAARLSSASDHPTPPLSPTSIDFYLQSQRNSTAFDNSSIRSGKSMSTIGGASIRSSNASSVGGNEGKGRLIAVTHQEEMLLAALRVKRARMRDQIIAEFEEEQHETGEAEGTPLHHPQPQHRYDQRTLQQLQNAPSQPLPDPPSKQRLSSESKRSSGRQISRHSSLSTVRLAPLPEQPYGEQQHQLHPPPSARSAPTPGARDGDASGRPTHGDERMLFYIDQTVGKMGGLNMAEPSPDLSDFMDFDGVGEDGACQRAISDTGSGSGKSAAPSGVSMNGLEETELFPAVPKGGSRRRVQNLSKLDTTTHPARSSSRPDKSDDVHVQVLENVAESSSTGSAEEADIPRPDSPISPVADFPVPTSQLPKKKQVRLSAVGYRPMEAGLWGDDG